MKLSENVKPISYLKSHASEIIHEIGEKHSAYVITLNGEAKVVVQDIREYEKTQESIALLKILAHSLKNLREGKVRPARDAFSELSNKIEEFQTK